VQLFSPGAPVFPDLPALLTTPWIITQATAKEKIEKIIFFIVIKIFTIIVKNM
jgi:hypothetical protein